MLENDLSNNIIKLMEINIVCFNYVSQVQKS